MKFLKNKVLISIVAAAIVIVTGVALNWNSGGDIFYGTKIGLRQFLNVHESPVIWLCVQGERFEGVRGLEPYYLSVTNSDCIFFVTALGRPRRFQYHFISLKEHQHWDFEGGDGVLGHGIATPATNFIHDWVDSVQLPRVTIASRLDGAVRKFEFNLDSRTMVEIKN